MASDGKTGFYIRRVCAAIGASLGRDFRLSRSHPKRRSSWRIPASTQAISATSGISACPKSRYRTDDALVLVIDFQLTVR